MEFIFRPQYGGKDCAGDTVQAQLCNVQVSFVYMLSYAHLNS